MRQSAVADCAPAGYLRVTRLPTGNIEGARPAGGTPRAGRWPSFDRLYLPLPGCCARPRADQPGPHCSTEGGRPPVMNIVVCVKQVPDTGSERTLKDADSTLDREASDALINELDEYAIEEGLRLAEASGGEVTILSMGPPRASESIRKALSMGADKAVHLVDDGLAGSDALATSAAIAAVLGRIGFDLVILGSESTAAGGGGLAARLPSASGCRSFRSPARWRPTARRSRSTARPT